MVDVITTNNEVNPEGVNILTPEQLKELETNGRLLSHIEACFTEASDHRSSTEDKWLAAYRAWRGVYSPTEEAKLKDLMEKQPGTSKVFVKITKTKVQAAIGQIYEVIFANDDFPLGVEPTPVPEGVSETVTMEMEESATGIPKLEDIYGYSGDGLSLPPGATTVDVEILRGKIGELASKIAIKEGKSPDKNIIPEFYPAKEAAAKAEKTIKDQLQETHAEFALRKLVFDQVCFGTGVLKGPVGYDKVYHNYKTNEETGEVEYSPNYKFKPKLEHVSCWDFYPDPTARRVEDCDYVIQRHLMNKKQLRALKNNTTFRKEAINTILQSAPNYNPEGWEQMVKDDSRDTDSKKYEVLEYWGYIDYDLAVDLGIVEANSQKEKDVELDVQINAWICGSEVLRVVINPFKPVRLPYFTVPYEEHPLQIWGIGVPENMEDSQALMNTHYRLALTNLSLAGSVVFEVDETTLVPGQDMTVYAGKVFRKQGGAPGQSIFSTKFQDTSPSHMQMFDRARQIADEATGIPSFSHGQTGINSTTRTASGMSMLMSAAALNIKTVVKNIDHFLIKPLGEAMYQWNMQFNEEDLELRGDLEIVAKGTSSLMQKEVQSQRLISFMQIVASNQITAPLGNYQYIIKEIAKALDLDTEKVLNDMETAKMFAELIALQQGGQGNEAGSGGNINAQAVGQNGGDTGGVPTPTGAAGEAGYTGNGNSTIGTGAVPQPGEASFSAAGA